MILEDALKMDSIALGSNLILQFCRWRWIPVYPGRSKNKNVLSCLLSNRPGKTETDCPLANQMVPMKAAKYEIFNLSVIGDGVNKSESARGQVIFFEKIWVEGDRHQISEDFF